MLGPELVSDVTVSDYSLGLFVLVFCVLTGMAFLFHYWRYDPLTRSTEVDLDLDAATAVETATSALVDARVHNVTVSLGAVTGYTYASFRSIGTRCRIEIKPAEHGYRLVCECRPRASLVLTDWGDSRVKLESIARNLEARVEAPDCSKDNESLTFMRRTTTHR